MVQVHLHILWDLWPITLDGFPYVIASFCPIINYRSTWSSGHVRYTLDFNAIIYLYITSPLKGVYIVAIKMQ